MKKHFLLCTALTLSLAGCGKQTPVDVSTYGIHKGAGSTGIHTVLPGDTVYAIAQNYQLPMREIITLNNIQAPYVLNTGFRMKLPPPNEHEVREGDTVTSIAQLYEVSPSQLVKLNNLQPPYDLMPRMPLRLPPPSVSYALPQAGKPATAQEAGFSNAEEIVQSARVEPVERQGIEQSQANKTVTPQNKPQVQEASIQRAKLPEHTPKMSGNGRFMRPVDGDVISTYGPKADGLHNDGINIRAVKGSPVRAAENGIVVYTGDDLAGYGNLVLVRHENKMMTAYAHLNKTLVTRGAKVTRGQSIGTVGSSGQVDSPQLHFEVRRGSEALDPLKYL